MPAQKSKTKKMKNLKNAIQKVENALKNDWGVSKTLKKKREQIGKQLLAQKKKELDALKALKKFKIAEEADVRFFSKEYEQLENLKEATAKNQKEKEGRYVSAKARTKRLLRNEKNMKKYLDKIKVQSMMVRKKLDERYKIMDKLAEEAEAAAAKK